MNKETKETEVVRVMNNEPHKLKYMGKYFDEKERRTKLAYFITDLNRELDDTPINIRHAMNLGNIVVDNPDFVDKCIDAMTVKLTREITEQLNEEQVHWVSFYSNRNISGWLDTESVLEKSLKDHNHMKEAHGWNTNYINKMYVSKDKHVVIIFESKGEVKVISDKWIEIANAEENGIGLFQGIKAIWISLLNGDEPAVYTGRVRNLKNLFKNCDILSMDFLGLDTSSIKSVDGLFSKSKIEILTLGEDFERNIKTEKMFYNADIKMITLKGSFSYMHAISAEKERNPKFNPRVAIDTVNKREIVLTGDEEYFRQKYDKRSLRSKLFS